MPVIKGEMPKATRVVRGDPSGTSGNDTNGLPYNIEFDRIYYGNDLKFDRWSSGYFWIKNTGTGTLTFLTSSSSSGTASQFSDPTKTPVLYYAIPGVTSGEVYLEVIGTTNSIEIAPGKRICLINRNANDSAGLSYSNTEYVSFGLTGNTTVEIGGSWGALAPCLRANKVLQPYCFYNMFNSGMPSANTKVTVLSSPTDSGSEDIDCYNNGMDHAFYGCIGLRSFPDMNFNFADQYSFSYIFYGCTKLGSSDTESAHVPDITFGRAGRAHLYEYAFYGCTSIVTGPRLCDRYSWEMANYADYSYASTFRGCTSMTSLKEQYIGGWTIADHAFFETFYGCTHLVHPMGFRPNIRKEVLTVYNYGFAFTFYQCSALRTVPNGLFAQEENPDPNSITLTVRTCPTLIAVGSSGYSFNNMFYGCTSLTSNPYYPDNTYDPTKAIPAAGGIILGSHDKNAAARSFENMFYSCTALTDMSSVWSPSMSNDCNASYSCSNMFRNCTHLVRGACPRDTVSAIYCWQHMFRGCTALKSVVGFNLSNTANYCCRYMFYGCTSLEVSPYLTPDTLVGTRPYDYMFAGCTNLHCIITNQNTHGSTTLAWTWHLPETGVFIKTNSAYTSTQKNTQANQNASSVSTSAQYIPYDWDIQTSALIFKSDSSFSVKLTKIGSPTALATLNYINVGAGTSGDYLSIVNGSWGSGSASGKLISSTGAPIIFYGGTTNGGYFSTSESDYYQFVIPTGNNVECIGNLNSLCTAVSGTLSSYISYKFYKLFAGCTALSKLSSLVSIGTLAVNRGYNFKQMFEGCTSLTEAPTIKATTAGREDYAFIFKDCSSLQHGPSLSSITDMSTGSFTGMFYNCITLASVITLPGSSVSLASQCFMHMYYNCKSITDIPENYLPWTSLASQCYAAMFDTCDNLVNVPSGLLPATSLSEACYANMFQNCSSLIDAPSLPATSMTAQCYQYMFRGCTSLTSITVNFSSWANSWGSSAYRTTYGWTENVGPEGHFNCPTGLPVYMNDPGNGSNSAQNTGSTDTSACYIPYNWTHTSSNTPVDPKIFRFERASGTVTITANSVINYGNGIYVSTDGTTWTPQTGKTSSSPWSFTIDQNHPRVCLKYYYNSPIGVPSTEIFQADSDNSTVDPWFSVSGSGTINATGDLTKFCIYSKISDLYSYSSKSVAGIFKNISQLRDCTGIYFSETYESPCYIDSMFYNSGVTKINRDLISPCSIKSATLAFANCTSLTDGCNLVTAGMEDNIPSLCFYGAYMNCTSLKSTAASPLVVGKYSQYSKPGCYNRIGDKAFKKVFRDCSCQNFNSVKINFRYLGIEYYVTHGFGVTYVLHYSKRTFEEAFYGCTHMNVLWTKMNRWPANYCTNNWVYGVSGSGTFNHLSELTTFPHGNDKVPSGWEHEEYVSWQ